jgi:uncharacterized BrkB/YihY/UPF0761 family membrane protein
MTDFTERINELQSEIDRLESDVSGKTATNRVLVIALVAPLLIATVLWFWGPSITMKKLKDGTMRFDKIRLGLWTMIISMVLWSVMALYINFF